MKEKIEVFYSFGYRGQQETKIKVMFDIMVVIVF
jgi:hypothetical protein